MGWAMVSMSQQENLLEAQFCKIMVEALGYKQKNILEDLVMFHQLTGMHHMYRQLSKVDYLTDIQMVYSNLINQLIDKKWLR